MEIRQLGKDRIEEAGSVLSDAFWEYEEVLHLLPNEARRARLLPRYLTADCRDAIRFGTLFGAFHDDALVGVSAWLPPAAYPESPPRRIGVGCYLTTATGSNVSWYGRFGFEVTEEFHPTPRWPAVWRMWRRPQ